MKTRDCIVVGVALVALLALTVPAQALRIPLNNTALDLSTADLGDPVPGYDPLLTTFSTVEHSGSITSSVFFDASADIATFTYEIYYDSGDAVISQFQVNEVMFSLIADTGYDSSGDVATVDINYSTATNQVEFNFEEDAFVAGLTATVWIKAHAVDFPYHTGRGTGDLVSVVADDVLATVYTPLPEPVTMVSLGLAVAVGSFFAVRRSRK